MIKKMMLGTPPFDGRTVIKEGGRFLMFHTARLSKKDTALHSCITRTEKRVADLADICGKPWEGLVSDIELLWLAMGAILIAIHFATEQKNIGYVGFSAIVTGFLLHWGVLSEASDVALFFTISSLLLATVVRPLLKGWEIRLKHKSKA